MPSPAVTVWTRLNSGQQTTVFLITVQLSLSYHVIIWKAFDLTLRCRPIFWSKFSALVQKCCFWPFSLNSRHSPITLIEREDTASMHLSSIVSTRQNITRGKWREGGVASRDCQLILASSKHLCKCVLAHLLFFAVIKNRSFFFVFWSMSHVTNIYFW